MKITHQTEDEKKEYRLAWARANKDKIALYNKKYRDKNPNYQNEWNAKNKDKAKAIWKKAYANNREQHIKNSTNWMKRNPEKVKATKESQRIKHAFEEQVRYQTNLKWKKEPQCGICKTDKNLQFHHWIYKIPVEKKHFSTLCTYCHGVQHGGLR